MNCSAIQTSRTVPGEITKPLEKKLKALYNDAKIMKRC
jgi:hypothetical protein